MLLETVEKTISDNALLNKGDTVICAVSGGADSVCLLYVMLELREKFDLSIVVANVNHMIRGEESDRDSRFVADLCKEKSIEFFYREYDVKKIATERKIGEEECGRILRYEFFEELSEKFDNAKIATAHNMGDNAETILFRLIRGSSSAGLCGIKYKRRNIVRPLLDVDRCEIEEFLRNRGCSWCEDSTNKQQLYTRNKLRLCVIPELEKISEGARQKIVSASKIISQDNAFLEELAEELKGKCFFETYLLTEPISGAPLPVARRVAASVLNEWGAEVNFERVEKFITFMKKDSGKRFDICKGKYAEKNYGKVSLAEKKFDTSFCKSLEFNAKIYGEGWSIETEVSSIPVRKNGNGIAVFDADLIEGPLTVRYRMNGDKIKLKGCGGTKKISDIFSDEKIDRYKRDYIPIIEKNGEILYVGGLRQSGLYSVCNKTKNFLIIRYSIQKKDEVS